MCAHTHTAQIVIPSRSIVICAAAAVAVRSRLAFCTTKSDPILKKNPYNSNEVFIAVFIYFHSLTFRFVELGFCFRCLCESLCCIFVYFDASFRNASDECVKNNQYSKYMQRRRRRQRR